MNEKELQKLSKNELIHIIKSELTALNGLIELQDKKIEKLNNTVNRELTTLFWEDAQRSGYTVARDLLLRFISEHTHTKTEKGE